MVPEWLFRQGLETSARPKWLTWLMAFAVGLSLFAVLSQLRIMLPWTPVPITGQTFAALFVALVWGRVQGTLVAATHMLLVAPLFGLYGSLMALQPTMGYLMGMLAATFVVGSLADRGWSKTWLGSITSVLIGTGLIYAFGLAFLSFYIPSGQLLSMGLWPFLIGDLAKALFAASLALKLRQKLT